MLILHLEELIPEIMEDFEMKELEIVKFENGKFLKMNQDREFEEIV